jgi:heme/copper-type cytochrome/quinol oxidase subunit 2
MVGDLDLEVGGYRKREVDEVVYLPVSRVVRVLVTAGDVLHSWSVPALGFKMDGVPGRRNGFSVTLRGQGRWYGQCSELCGSEHASMPIVLQGVKDDEFAFWLTERTFPLLSLTKLPRAPPLKN